VSAPVGDTHSTAALFAGGRCSPLRGEIARGKTPPTNPSVLSVVLRTEGWRKGLRSFDSVPQSDTAASFIFLPLRHKVKGVLFFLKEKSTKKRTFGLVTGRSVTSGWSRRPPGLQLALRTLDAQPLRQKQRAKDCPLPAVFIFL